MTDQKTVHDCPHGSAIADLTRRMSESEIRQSVYSAKLDHISNDTAQIRAMLEGVRGIGGFVQRNIGVIVALAVSAGWFGEKFGAVVLSLAAN